MKKRARALWGLAVAVSMAGCSHKQQNSAITPASPPAPQKPDYTDKLVDKTPANVAMKKYASPVFNQDRKQLCDFIQRDAHVVSARSEIQGTDSNVVVTLKPSATAKSARVLAKTIRDYMNQHFSGESAYKVAQINLVAQAGVATAASDSESSQSDTDGRQIDAVITTAQNAGTGNPQGPPDFTWHVFVGGDPAD